MRRQWYVLLFLLCGLAVFHVISLRHAAEQYRQLPKGEGAAFVLPAALLKITSLEYSGLVSDFLFLDALVFYGGTLDRKEKPRVKEWEWEWLRKMIDASTDLDPYFLDPYMFGNATFTWEAGMVREINEILEKGTRYRSWDWKLPFFAGFNYFYFLQEDAKAAELLMVASRRPDANPLLASIASKLAFKSQRTETAIQFLEELILRTDDEMTKQRFRTRLDALRNIHALEMAVDQYRVRYRQAPRNIDALVARGIIRELPRDPYGGSYSLDPSGAVKSTSESELVPHRKH